MNPALVLETTLNKLSAQSITNLFLVVLLGVFVIAVYFHASKRATRFVHYAPNLLTTLGILGTFIGIVIGLLGFDINDINQSIGPLLAGLKTAFITSLVGMLLAIAFKTIETSGLMVRSAKDEIPDDVGPEEILREMQAQRISTEKLTSAIVGDEESTLITQIRLLRSDSRDEAKTALEVLTRQATIQKSLADSARQQDERFLEFRAGLWQKLDDFAEMLSKSATEQVITALREVISDFNKNLTEQFGENFKELNSAVEKLVQWQADYKVQLEEMGRQYKQGVEAITQTESSVASISEESKVIPTAMAELKQVLEVSRYQIDELGRHLEAFSEMRNRAVEAVPQIQEQMDSMVQDVSSAVKDAGDQIMVSTKAVNESLIEGAKEFEDRVHRTNEGITNAATELTNNSERIRDQLTDTFKDVNANVREMIASITENTANVSRTLVDGNQSLANDIRSNQTQVADSLKQMQDRLESSLEEIFQAQTRSMNNSFSAIEDQLQSAVGRTGDAVTKQLEAMDSAMQDELVRVMNDLGQKLASVTGKFTQDYTALTQQMAEVVSQSRRVAADGDGRYRTSG